MVHDSQVENYCLSGTRLFYRSKYPQAFAASPKNVLTNCPNVFAQFFQYFPLLPVKSHEPVLRNLPKLCRVVLNLLYCTLV